MVVVTLCTTYRNMAYGKVALMCGDGAKPRYVVFRPAVGA